MSHLPIAPMCRPSNLARASLFVATLLAMVSCKSTSSSTSGDSLYASNHGANDGGYRPYNAAQGGTVQSTAPRSTVPQYDRAVPPPPPGYEAPSSQEFNSPPPAKSSSGSSSSGSTARKSSGSTPTKSSSTAAAKKKASSTPAKKKTSSASTYTVAKGDTLYGLALRKHTTVAKIKAASGISSDKLSIGQKLRIP